jgi:hypothetical protein
MTYYAVKIIISALLIVAISEIAKRSSLLGGLLASVPLISVMALTWLYIDTRDVNRISDLANSIFWLVLPSLALFASLPWLLRLGMNFYHGLGLSILLTAACYGLLYAAVSYYDIKL